MNRLGLNWCKIYQPNHFRKIKYLISVSVNTFKSIYSHAHSNGMRYKEKFKMEISKVDVGEAFPGMTAPITEIGLKVMNAFHVKRPRSNSKGFMF